MDGPYTRYLHTPGIFNFFRLLLKWRGSFYKLILAQCVVFFCIYFSILLLYTFLLPEHVRRHFESVLAMLARNRGELSSAVAFFLGFFIEQIYSRFWKQFLLVPWPDGFAFLVSACVVGRDMRSRVIRRTLVRYACAAIIMGMSQVARPIAERFPTAQSYVNCDLLTPNEANIVENIPTAEFSKHHILLSWACCLLRRARKENHIKDDFGYNDMYHQIDKIRSQLGALDMYNWVPVPLLYIHVVFYAVYSFFAVVVFTHPFEKWEFTTGHVFSVKDSDSFESDLDRETRLRMRFMFVVITLVQFFVFAGMLHTSEALIMPFGLNDNDIDINQLVDRHLRVSYLVVDEMYSVIPEMEMVDDTFWPGAFDEVDRPYRENGITHKLALP